MSKYKGKTTVVTIHRKTFEVATEALPMLVPERRPSLVKGRKYHEYAHAINTAGSYEEAEGMI